MRKGIRSLKVRVKLVISVIVGELVVPWTWLRKLPEQVCQSRQHLILAQPKREAEHASIAKEALPGVKACDYLLTIHANISI